MPSATPSACVDRRAFLRIAGAGTLSLGAFDPLTAIAGPFEPADTADHFVPADKKLKPEWIRALAERGQPTWYSGDDLRMFGMPVGGIGAGQLYLTGDGRLVHWDIFNAAGSGDDPPGGGTHFQTWPDPVAPLQQGFAARIRSAGATHIRTLDRAGFPHVRARGEYPIGLIEYADTGFPVTLRLEAFSPFIPLNAADSALPVTLLHWTVRNTTSAPVEVTLVGLLENGVGCHSGDFFGGVRENRAIRDETLALVLGSARSVPEPAAESRPPRVLADFEQSGYGDWTVQGLAFGMGPSHGTLPNQNPVSGFLGKGLVNTYLQGDGPRGRLVSPPFAIDRPFLNFLIGGGHHPGRTCMNLRVDGRVVRTAMGRNQERLAWQGWRVRDLIGKTASIEIVDQESGGWGHINIDQIELSDTPRRPVEGPLEEQHDFGTMGLVLLEGDASAFSLAAMPTDSLSALLERSDLPQASDEAREPFGRPLCGAVGRTVRLDAGQETTIPFAVVWHFPNRRLHGNRYATRFTDAQAVARFLGKEHDRLTRQTRAWRDTWYDSTLPYWLLDRLFAPVSILATSTCQWWANGRFWGWEGVRCCEGTCAHVWNYEHAMARLFPELERSVRERQDFGVGFVEETGAIHFRGESNDLWAGDSQGGTVLKALREHQMSADDGFLRRNWPHVRKAAEFLLGQDGNDDGLIEGSQHNTYDINFFGPNTMVGSLYLGALRAVEVMAAELGDAAFAARCRKVFESGSERTLDRLFNGEYFIQQVDLKEHPKYQYADGCLSDQLFGQGWAHQVGLGYLYPREKVRSALKAVWTYNWAPDIGPQNAAHPPQRWFARPGQAGLFTCTWPRSKHLGPDSVLYRDEVWTGIEYQVAGHMAWEGMLTEALAICRGVHERYHPARQNPWNEVECGDHYARAMASYGVFLGLCGCETHGPKGHLGFAPRLGPDRFRAAFTTAEGWGSYHQEIGPAGLDARLHIRWGQVRLRSLAFGVPADRSPTKVDVSVMGRAVPAAVRTIEGRAAVTLEEEVLIKQGDRPRGAPVLKFAPPGATRALHPGHETGVPAGWRGINHWPPGSSAPARSDAAREVEINLEPGLSTSPPRQPLSAS